MLDMMPQPAGPQLCQAHHIACDIPTTHYYTAKISIPNAPTKTPVQCQTQSPTHKNPPRCYYASKHNPQYVHTKHFQHTAMLQNTVPTRQKANPPGQNAIPNAQNAIPKAPHAAKHDPQCISRSKTRSPYSKMRSRPGLNRGPSDPKSDALIHCATGPHGNVAKIAVCMPSWPQSGHEVWATMVSCVSIYVHILAMTTVVLGDHKCLTTCLGLCKPRTFRLHRIRVDSPKSDALIHCATGPIGIYGNVPRFALYIPLQHASML